MRWTYEECNCNHGIFNLDRLSSINGARIELRCQVQSYSGMVAYFHRKDYANKTKWSEEEHKAMR